MEYCLSNTHWFDAVTPPMEAHLVRVGETVARLLDGRGPLTAVTVAPFSKSSAGNLQTGFVFRSEWTLFGLPLVHAAIVKNELPALNFSHKRFAFDDLLPTLGENVLIAKYCGRNRKASAWLNRARRVLGHRYMARLSTMLNLLTPGALSEREPCFCWFCP